MGQERHQISSYIDHEEFLYMKEISSMFDVSYSKIIGVALRSMRAQHKSGLISDNDIKLALVNYDKTFSPMGDVITFFPDRSFNLEDYKDKPVTMHIDKDGFIQIYK